MSEIAHVGGRQAYNEQRRRKDAEREAREAAEEAAAAVAEAERAVREDAEAAKWVGQISVEEHGEEAQTQEQAQVPRRRLALKIEGVGPFGA